MLSDVIAVLADLPPAVVLSVVAAAALLEGAVLAGLVLPGEAVVLLGGSLAVSAGTPAVLVWVTAAVASCAGDSIGYVVGRRLGPALQVGRIGRRVGEHRWSSATATMRRAGTRGVFAGKFIGVVRPLVPPLAGMSGLPYRRFLAASAAASAVWSAALVAIGAAAGSSATRWADRLGQVGWTVLAVALPVAVAVVLGRRRGAVTEQRRLACLQTSDAV